MKNKRKIGFLFILTVLIIKSAGGQSNTLFQDNYTKFYSYTTNQGLSCSDVLDVIQDKYGFIWVATKNGLNKFNGQAFTGYFEIENNQNSLPNNLITSLAEDIYGDVWVGTKNGLCKYVRRSNQFERLSIELSDSNIRALYADRKGNLWIETLLGGLNCLNIAANTLAHYPHQPLIFEGDYFYHFIFEDSKQRIWIGGRNFYPRFFDVKKKVFVPDESFNGNDGSCIFEDKNKTIWSSGNYGFNFYNETTARMDDSSLFQMPFRIQSALIDDSGAIWFGGNGDKVFCFNQNTEKWSYFSHSDANPFSMISTQINKIYKDKQNNLWFATSDGLCVKPSEINKFRHYRFIPGVSESLSSNKVTAILQDRNGTLWVGTQQNGVDTMCLNPEKFGNLKYEILKNNIDKNTLNKEKKILALYQKSNISKTESENNISALYEDSEGTIYIGLWSGIGFNKFTYTNGFKREYLFAEKGSTLFGNELIGANWYSDFLEDKQKKLWVATWEGIGLNLYNRSKKEFEGINFSGENTPFDKGVVSLINQNDSLLWLSNPNSYLCKVNVETGKFCAFISDSVVDETRFKYASKYVPFAGFTTTNLPLSKTGIRILADNNQNIWVVAGSNKISRFNNATGLFINYTLKTTNEMVLKTAFSNDDKKIYLATVSGKIISFSTVNYTTEIISMLKNKPHASINSIAFFDNKLWVSADNKLLSYSLENKFVETMDLKHRMNSNDLNINVIYCFGDTMFMASENEIFIREKGNNTITNFSESINFYPEITQFKQLFYDGSVLWAGSFSGLYKVEPETGKVTHFKHDIFSPNSIPDNEITAITAVKNELYVSTRNGMCKINRQTNQIALLNKIPSTKLSNRLLTRLFEDRDGFIWIGTTEKGANRMNPETLYFDHFFEIPGDSSSLLGNNVQSVFQQDNGTIWIGTDKALNKFNSITKSFERNTMVENYHLGVIKAIQEDCDKNLWISSANGLVRFTPESNEVTYFCNQNGIQDNTFSNASAKLTDGRLAFGGLNGVTVFDPGEIDPEENFPDVIIENLTINDSLWYVDFAETDSLFLSFFENNISFMLRTSEFFVPDLISFKYRLNGFENEWNTASVKNGQIKYNNLKPGNYLLEILSNNVYNKWNNNIRTCIIKIKKPWWETWWFILVALIGFGGVIISVIRLRERNLIEVKKNLEKKVNERTAQLEESVEQLKKSEFSLAEAVAAKDKFFSIVAHDLKNPVVALQLISDKLVTDFTRLSPHHQADLLATMNRQIHQTHSFLDNLLLWSLTQRNAIPFRPVTVYLDSLITEVLDLLQENARLKKIKLVKSVPDGLCAFADRNMVFTILNNLVNNALKFSFPDNQIIVTAWEDETLVKISVKDFGTGIPQEQLPKLFNITSKYRMDGTLKESGTGIGLLLSKEFAEKNGGKIFVESFENQGTNFYFTLPKTMSQ